MPSVYAETDPTACSSYDFRHILLTGPVTVQNMSHAIIKRNVCLKPQGVIMSAKLKM